MSRQPFTMRPCANGLDAFVRQDFSSAAIMSVFKTNQFRLHSVFVVWANLIQQVLDFNNVPGCVYRLRNDST